MSVVVQILAAYDPGISGGLAIVAVADGAAPRLVEVIDIPVIGVGAKERVDAAAIRDFIERHKPIRALIERAQRCRSRDRSPGIEYGRAVGAIEAAIALSSVPIEILQPSAWEKFWHLAGRDQEAAGNRRYYSRRRMRRSRASAITIAQRPR